MKKILFIVLLFQQAMYGQFTANFNNENESSILSFFEDCDACGCSASGGSMGFNSFLNDKFIGVRYMFQSYQSKDGVFNNSPWIDENFNTVQIWARVPITKKTEVMILAPYHFLSRVKKSENQSLSGIGDITIMGFYNLLQTKNDSAAIQQKLLLGAGIKAPTGMFNNKNNGSINPSFQLGTGSWDYSLATEYNIRFKKYGLNTNISYIFKTENEKNYQFGNQLNYSANLFYNAQLKNVIIVPQLGIAGEEYKSNTDFNEVVPKTEGDIFFSKIGFEIGLSRFSAGFNTMLPINQNLTGNKVKANYRIAFNINYVL
ncbi:transporter [Myroides sp. JBRI-B21084]|uniref:transporter n=1 Tax=Myroides sp. JBRI-B21084 TaxID=3119977 RepID=UPI0026E37F9D|nr:transporter [Paenimyroides cloacae]WKW46803.1 transporter [Paenimyroides cloacae]